MRRHLKGMSRRNIAGLATALLLHALVLMYLTAPVTPELRTKVETQRASGVRPLVVRLLAKAPVPPKLEPPTVIKKPPTRSPTPTTTKKAVQVEIAPPPHASPDAASSEPPTARPPGQLNIYSRDGSIALPTKPMSFGKDGVVNMDIKSPIPCHQTSLADKWDRGQDEDAGSRVARKYLRWVGLYNPAVEARYQRRAAEHKENCQPSSGR